MGTEPNLAANDAAKVTQNVTAITLIINKPPATYKFKTKSKHINYLRNIVCFRVFEFRDSFIFKRRLDELKEEEYKLSKVIVLFLSF